MDSFYVSMYRTYLEALLVRRKEIGVPYTVLLEITLMFIAS